MFCRHRGDHHIQCPSQAAQNLGPGGDGAKARQLCDQMDLSAWVCRHRRFCHHELSGCVLIPAPMLRYAPQNACLSLILSLGGRLAGDLRRDRGGAGRSRLLHAGGERASPIRWPRCALNWASMRPRCERYFAWVGGMLTGDFGTSYTYRTPVIADDRETGFWISLPLAPLCADAERRCWPFPQASMRPARRGQGLEILR